MLRRKGTIMQWEMIGTWQLNASNQIWCTKFFLYAKIGFFQLTNNFSFYYCKKVKQERNNKNTIYLLKNTILCKNIPLLGLFFAPNSHVSIISVIQCNVSIWHGIGMLEVHLLAYDMSHYVAEYNTYSHIS